MFEGFVDEGGIEYVVFGFVGELGFPVLAGGFVNAEGALEVGLFDVKVPVAEPALVDAGDFLEVFVGVIGESAVVAGGGEGAVPEGVGVGVVEGVAGCEIGVVVEVAFERFPSGFAVGIEEFCSVGVGGEEVVEGGPVFLGMGGGCEHRGFARCVGRWGLKLLNV